MVTLNSKAIASMNPSSFFFAGKNCFKAFSSRSVISVICFVLDQCELIEEVLVSGFFDHLEEESSLALKSCQYTSVDEAYQQVNYPQMLRGSLWIFVDLCGSLWIFVDICGFCGYLWM